MIIWGYISVAIIVWCEIRTRRIERELNARGLALDCDAVWELARGLVYINAMVWFAVNCLILIWPRF